MFRKKGRNIKHNFYVTIKNVSMFMYDIKTFSDTEISRYNGMNCISIMYS